MPAARLPSGIIAASIPPGAAMIRRFLQLEVFARRAGEGNPLAVVLDAGGLDTAAMQRFAAWTNLSETTFVVPPARPGADFGVRIFTPRQELPFAGHPTVGTAWAAVEAGLVAPRDGHLVLDCAAGPLLVRVENDGGRRLTHVRAPHARLIGANHADLLTAATCGWRFGALPAAIVDNGPRWWLVELADAAAVRGLVPDPAAIAALTRASGTVGLAVFARTTKGDHALVVRAFCPADNIPEDPVTGSAQAAIAAFLQHHGRLPGPRYRASQGREVGRDGTVEVAVDAADAVWIGGPSVAVIRGTLEDWPA